MEQQQTSIFGDDINSTPISNLQPMQPMVQTKKDAPPVEPPIYDPNPPAPIAKRVHFEEPVYKKPRKEKRNVVAPPLVPEYASLFHQQFNPPPVPEAPKPRKIVQLLESYGTYMTVFALVVVALWYMPRVAAMPYVGTGSGLSILGIIAVALGVASSFGIISSVLE